MSHLRPSETQPQQQAAAKSRPLAHRTSSPLSRRDEFNFLETLQPCKVRQLFQPFFLKWSAETKGLVWGACCAERRALKILERALKILDRGVKFHRASLGVHGALQNSQDASVFRDFARGKFSEILERARKKS